MRNSHNIFAGIKISIGPLVVTRLVAAASKRGAIAGPIKARAKASQLPTGVGPRHGPALCDRPETGNYHKIQPQSNLPCF